MKTIILPEQSIIKVSGADALSFLQGLITNDLNPVKIGQSCYAALLTPQGKVVADFVVHHQEDGYYLDVWQGFAAELLKRLNMYKLRAQVSIEDVSGAFVVMTQFMLPPSGGAADRREAEGGMSSIDPRLANAYRRITPLSHASLHSHDSSPTRGEQDYRLHLILNAIPQSGIDFGMNEVFPHEINMDLLNGLSVTKGCYTGQEVVSRMHHKGNIRTRSVKVEAAEDLPLGIHEIMAGPIQIGTLGARSGTIGLARLRVDRAQEAQANGLNITIGDVNLSGLLIPGLEPGIQSL